MCGRACPFTSVVERHNKDELGFSVFLFFEPHNYHCVCASFGRAVTDGGPAAMAPAQNSCSEISALLYTMIPRLTKIIRSGITFVS